MFRYRLSRFMSGRYGVIDTLFCVLFGTAAVLAIVNCFLHKWWLQLPVYLLTLTALLRFFSRNTAARYRENQRIHAFIGKKSREMQIKKARNADRNHVYKKCPSCGVVL
ncbi:MAG: hypothetical protein MJ132_07615, partial [Clostridia bacterium]|nr:hypothetical protein [Clostridia bacterium]